MSALINPLAHQLSAIGGALRVARAEGVRLYDDAGRSWIDCESGGGTFSLGHRHPAVLEVFKKSIELLDLGNHHLVSESRGKLASAIQTVIQDKAMDDMREAFDGAEDDLASRQAPIHELQLRFESSMRCVFNVSASESIDCAIKLARGASGRNTIVCALNAFHGHTGFALAASAAALRTHLPAQLPGFVTVPYGPPGATAYALQNNPDVAAVLLEPVAVEAGCIVPSRGYLSEVLDVCRKHGAYLIVDESVTGLGRTGSVFAWIRHAALPDIFTIGCALGGGQFPISVTCHADKLDRFYVENPFIHVSTFGGGEVGCAAAQAALEHLTDDAFLQNVVARGEQFRKGIQSPGHLVDVRGVGLLNAIEMHNADAAQRLRNALFSLGVLCRQALLAPQTLLFLPPLTITPDEMQEVINAVNSGLQAASGEHA